jgi:Conserved in the green lineage and diatoms 27
MNSNIKIFLLCPVPEEQKPINGYIGLKENQLTNWTTLSKKNYEKKLLSLFSFFFLLVSFFRVSSFSDSRYVFDWFLITFSLSLTLLFFLVLLIFFRWKQIEKDFNQPRLFYEEASWYDGQIWEKPFSILKNDKLISTQKIKPILQRISRTMFTLLSWNLGFFLLLKIE